jgi:hypothetical protein
VAVVMLAAAVLTTAVLMIGDATGQGKSDYPERSRGDS